MAAIQERTTVFMHFLSYIITAAEMKYMRRTAGYIWTDYKTNAQISKQLKITPTLEKVLKYKKKT